jgi:hypothetical protein
VDRESGVNGFGVFTIMYTLLVLGVCGWLALRSPSEELRPPDPTVGEARALIVGLVCFWGLWAPFGLTIDHHPGIAAPFIVPMIGAGIWLWIGGFGALAARMAGMTLGRWITGGRPRRWRDRDRRLGFILNVDFFRRSARTLGWSPSLVFSLLGLFFVADLTVLVTTFRSDIGR